jgi:hypothetical protein
LPVEAGNGVVGGVGSIAGGIVRRGEGRGTVEQNKEQRRWRDVDVDVDDRRIDVDGQSELDGQQSRDCQ